MLAKQATVEGAMQLVAILLLVRGGKIVFSERFMKRLYNSIEGLDFMVIRKTDRTNGEITYEVEPKISLTFEAGDVT